MMPRPLTRAERERLAEAERNGIEHATYDEAYWRGWRAQRDEAIATAADLIHCVVCGDWHEGCQFESGSIMCVRPACPNPHHRREVKP